MPYTPYHQASWIDDFTGWVLQLLDLTPTAWRQEFLQTWSQFETGGGTAGTGPSYNPFGTTYKTPGAMPNVGGQENVWHFPTAIEGAWATAQTIRNYPQVMAALSNENISQPGALSAEIGGSWGTGGFANLVGGGWSPSGDNSIATPVAPMPDRTFISAPEPSPPPPVVQPYTPPPPPIATPVTSNPVASRYPAVPPQIVQPPPPAYVPTPQPNGMPVGVGGFPLNIQDIAPGAGIPQTALQQGQTNIVNLHENIPVSALEGWTAYRYNGSGWTQVTSGDLNGIISLHPTGAHG